MICVDTNILIYAHRSGTPENRTAQAAIERAMGHRRGWGIALPSVGEFWAQVTHPRFPGGASTPAEAAGFLQSLSEEGGARIFLPRSDLVSRLLETLAAHSISGPRVFDIQIALVAQGGGATQIWTHDANFVRLPGLQIEDPLRP